MLSPRLESKLANSKNLTRANLKNARIVTLEAGGRRKLWENALLYPIMSDDGRQQVFLSLHDGATWLSAEHGGGCCQTATLQRRR